MSREFSPALEIRFKDNSTIKGIIAKLREVHKKRHKVYDGLVDKQLDKPEPLDLWSLAATKRGEFDTLLKEAKKLRKDLMAAVDAEILGAKPTGCLVWRLW